MGFSTFIEINRRLLNLKINQVEILLSEMVDGLNQIVKMKKSLANVVIFLPSQPKLAITKLLQLLW